MHDVPSICGLELDLALHMELDLDLHVELDLCLDLDLGMCLGLCVQVALDPGPPIPPPSSRGPALLLLPALGVVAVAAVTSGPLRCCRRTCLSPSLMHAGRCTLYGFTRACLCVRVHASFPCVPAAHVHVSSGLSACVCMHVSSSLACDTHGECGRACRL